MFYGIDFSIDYPVSVALIASAFFPFVLIVITKISYFAGRNAIQFLFCFLITTIGWLIGLFFLINKHMMIGTESFYVSFFLYNGMMLGYLEIWGLLSRGYTLGLLLTFYKAGTPLSANELARLYRGGEGLHWLMKHRFVGLVSAKMIKREGNLIILTTRGCVVAYLYKLLVSIFGLRYSG